MATTVTKTIKSSGGDYTSLSAWEAGEQGDLTGVRDEISVAECYAMSDTTVVSIDGWTTSATQYIKIYTPGGERHDGKWSTSAYRLVAGGDYVAGSTLQINEPYTQVVGLQIEYNYARTAGSPNAITINPGALSGRITISHCLVRFTGSGTGISGIYIDGGSSAQVDIYNNVTYNFPSSGISCGPATGSTNNAYSNTLYGNGTGITSYAYTTGVLNLKNNLANGNTTDYYFEGGHTRNTATNLSEDTSSPDNTWDSLAVSFVDEANRDLHLASSDTAAKNQGTDLSADGALAFSTDVDGDTRTGTWDIGADEYVAAAVPSNAKLVKTWLV